MTSYPDPWRSFARLGVLAGAAFVLAGCGHNSSPAASGGQTASGPRPFVVAYNQWIGLVGVFIAKDKGYFDTDGVNVQLKQFSGPADGLPPLVAGQIDGALTTADSPILLANSNSASLVQNVWITDTSNGADGIVADKSIATVKDLKGKNVAATRGQVNEFLLMTALKQSGMAESDVQITNMGADDAGAAIIAKKVPAAVTWEPWLTKAQAGGGAHLIFSSRQAPNTILDVFTVTKKTLADRPADVKAFIAACAQGADYANAHPDEAAQAAAKYLGSSVADARDMLTKVKVYGAADNRRLMGTATAPGPAVKTVTDIGQFFVAQKALTTAPEPGQEFTTDYLPQ